MADLQYMQDDDAENSDEGGDLSDEYRDQESSMSPLVRLERFAISDIMFNRQLVGRLCVEALKAVAGNPEEVAGVVAVINRVSADSVPAVQIELMERIPQIARVCQEDSSLEYVINSSLLPIVVKFLGDQDNQVRRAAQVSLLIMMEQYVLDIDIVEEKVCPIILELTQTDRPVDYHTGAIHLMSKMAPLLGSERTERLFINRFAELCMDQIFYVRKCCASNFGEICTAVSTKAAEEILLPRFIELCEDEIWGVRKACAEVFMSVSCACTLAIRKEKLAPVFANLLDDHSRWVRGSAFQTLGPFISTFADPSITGVTYNDEGELVIVDHDGCEFKLKNHSTMDCDIKMLLGGALNVGNSIDFSADGEELTRLGLDETFVEDNNVSVINSCDNKEETVNNSSVSESEGAIDNVGDELIRVSEGSGQFRIHVESGDPNSFNTFQYWRLPIPELSLDINMTESGKPTSVHVTAKVKDDVTQRTYASELNVSMEMDLDKELNNLASRLEQGCVSEMGEGDAKVQQAQICTASMAVVTDVDQQGRLYSNVLKSTRRKVIRHTSVTKSFLKYQAHELNNKAWWQVPAQMMPQPVQDIVPQSLIDSFVSMTNPYQAQGTDNDIVHHCAFSIPAVALTLGRENWNLLKQAYEALASDVQWKVRLTVASSIHELAVILGEEIATKDLVPIFNGFIKDLDEVRIGALKHLADFLKLLQPDARNSYLEKLPDLHFTDNIYNWRFRMELAEQLILCVPLFSPENCYKHIFRIAMKLSCDRVAAVREKSLILLAQLVKYISVDKELIPELLVVITELVVGDYWKTRQKFVLLASRILSENALTDEEFGAEILPNLLSLAQDPIPNVRLVLARTLANDVMTRDYFRNGEYQHYNELCDTMNMLGSDSDRDVRIFSAGRSVESAFEQ